MPYSELCHNIKKRICWDKIFFSPSPRSNVIREGYRIDISLAKEEEIQMAKKILQEAQIIFDDKRATSYSESIKPGDRTLRVIHQKSVVNLRQLWTDELKKHHLQVLKKQQERK